MGFHLFRSRDKSPPDVDNESLSGYDEYGMKIDKQWARKYLLDPLTAPEPCQETWSRLQHMDALPAPRQEQEQKTRCFSPWSSSPRAGAGGVDGVTNNHRQHRDLRDALGKVSRRFLQFKQRCRRSSPANFPSRSQKNVSESGSGSEHEPDHDIVRIETKANTTNNNYRDGDDMDGKHTSRSPKDTRYAATGPGDSRASWSSFNSSGRVADFDPTNPYYGTCIPSHHQPRCSRSSSSDHHRGHRRHARPSMSGSSHHTRHASSSAALSARSRRRSSANTTASSSAPSLYACSSSSSIDLGPYPAHLTLPKPMPRQPMLARRHRNLPGAPAPVSWKANKCNQLDKARGPRANHEIAK